MEKLNSRDLRGLAAAALLIAFAVFIRQFSFRTSGFVSLAASLIRSLIYIGMTFAWSVSISRRILQKSARRCLLTIAGLLIFWLCVRTCKYFLFDGMDTVVRYCWYCFYFPMLLIPPLAICAAECMGRPEDYVVPRQMKLLFLPALVMISIVLTNDLHQKVFAFSGGILTHGGNGSYSYGPVYFVIISWIILQLIAFLIILGRKSRIPGRTRRIAAPFVPLIFGLAYAVFYICETTFHWHISTDMTVVFCLLTMSIVDACIRSGMIPSNRYYKELFRTSELRARIVDPDNRLYLASADARPLSEETINAAKEAPVIFDDGMRLSSAPVRGGRVFWEEDISELLDILERLSEHKETLENDNLVSEANYRKERAVHALREKNRLYDQMRQMSADQLALSGRILEAYLNSGDDEDRRRLLAGLVVVGTSVKRKNNLIFSGEQYGSISGQELEQCFDDYFRALRLYGARGGFYLNLKNPVCPKTALEIFTFFESVIEASAGGLESVLLRVLDTDTGAAVCVDISGDANYQSFSSDRVTVNTEDPQCCTLLFRPEGGPAG